ncbi:hypothetical protein [Pseudovibrio sp. POLY-S9]|uniref:hypothetical protein n=1 Tax=Pseudovibrio sp. POLY-S9 TaxID=1576596 RepID=UPI00070F62BF|nr:hypothetical protein [Pseudovibrio sp. POLY-S9]
MTRWVDAYKGHQIHETVQQSLEWVETKFDKTDRAVEVERLRLVKFLKMLSGILDILDPELSPTPQLTNLNNHLRQQHFWNELYSFSNSGQKQHLINANNQLDSQFATIHQLAWMTKRTESSKIVREVEKVFNAFCTEIEESTSNLKTRIDANDQQISEVEAKESTLQQALNDLDISQRNLLANWQTEFTEAETARAKEHSDATIKREKEFSEFIRNTMDEAVKTRTDIANEHREKFANALNAFETNIETTEKDISSKHQSILDIHGLVASDGVAGHYQSGAELERKQASTWRWITMACYLATLAWVVFKGKLGFGLSQSGSIDWPTIITTLSVTGVAFVAAQFASRQSRLHRLNEQRMSWFFLEMKALDPFISSLPIETQQELKKQLSERIFGQDRVIDEKPSSGVKDTTVEKALELASSTTSQALKAFSKDK